MLPQPPNPAVIWTVNAADRPACHRLDGEYIVFNPLTGKTHFLDTAAGVLLEAVMAKPESLSHLCMRLAAFLDVDDDEEVANLVSATLAKLDDLGLIEPSQ